MQQYCEYSNLRYAFYEGVGKYQFPEVRPIYEMPKIDNWIGFNYAKTTTKNKEKTGVNFYIHDYQFERVWNSPDRYSEVLKQYGAVIGPDFSTYLDFPEAIRIYNTYRNRWLERYWQDKGITVIPDVGWGLKDSYDWCFDGLPEGSIVSVSNIGCMKNKETRQYFMDGYNEMLIRLQPKKVLFYTFAFDDYKGPVEFIRYDIDKAKQV